MLLLHLPLIAYQVPAAPTIGCVFETAVATTIVLATDRDQCFHDRPDRDRVVVVLWQTAKHIGSQRTFRVDAKNRVVLPYTSLADGTIGYAHNVGVSSLVQGHVTFDLRLPRRVLRGQVPLVQFIAGD